MRWYVSSCDDLHSDIELPPNEVIALGNLSFCTGCSFTFADLF